MMLSTNEMSVCRLGTFSRAYAAFCFPDTIYENRTLNTYASVATNRERGRPIVTRGISAYIDNAGYAQRLLKTNLRMRHR